uniref:XRE family transcriptional regulator n=1 Tax=Candidatus Kentrum sp. DK TaxID=2126562 RepID=A0A450SYJ3_9GAMM|nr:MAG: hypothetical protein BECKDK2373C_GA0170839_107019 [Candidatus Kentron sp. DK]VFJ59368.1 MAG: hypothetical protein BECKDK2373B_GA0170837_108214 [Candidatus Kentron sp. DK]
MPHHVRDLIDQIISTAEGRGIPLAWVAGEAGMTIAELNTVREYGDIRAAALVALGKQVNLELTFVAKKSTGQSREKVIRDIKAGAFFRHGS